MAISFNQIPTTQRAPFVYAEFDNSNAVQGPALMPYKELVVGQRLATGTVAAGVLTRCTSAAQAAQYFGAGSMLAQMAEAHFANNKVTETWFLALADDGAAVAASGSVTVGGTIAAGSIVLYVGGRRLTVGVAAGDTAAEVATAIAAAINARSDLPVTAQVDAETDEQVNITARQKGVAGNGIDVRHSYHQGEALPAGMTLTFSGAGTVDGSPSTPWEWAAATAAVAAYYGNIDPARPFQTLELKAVLPPKDGAGMRLTNGATNPDTSGIWATVGDEHFNVIAWPYTDAANLLALETELTDRTGPLRQIEAHAIAAAYGSHSTLGTLGDSRNSQHLSIMGTGGIFTLQERNLLLFDGISTFKVDAGGKVRIERLITTYKVSGNGAEDPSYLDVNTLMTLAYLRYDFRNFLLRKYPRHKLADDGTRYGEGQAIITPKIGKAEAIARFRLWEEMGLVEGADQFKRDLIVERNAGDANRLDFYLPPDLVNQFRIGGVQIGFLL